MEGPIKRVVVGWTRNELANCYSQIKLRRRRKRLICNAGEEREGIGFRSPLLPEQPPPPVIDGLFSAHNVSLSLCNFHLSVFRNKSRPEKITKRSLPVYLTTPRAIIKGEEEA